MIGVGAISGIGLQRKRCCDLTNECATYQTVVKKKLLVCGKYTPSAPVGKIPIIDKGKARSRLGPMDQFLEM